MTSVLPSILLIALLLVALVRLPALHPIQLYSAPWAAATTLYAFKLLPYRSLSWFTAAFICGAALAFSLGTLAGDRVLRRFSSHETPSTSPAFRPRAVRLAALTTLIIGGLLFTAFLAQTVARFGITDTLLVSRGVRQTLIGGAAPRSFAYVRFAFPAVVLCSLAAALATNPAGRRRWILASACAAGSLYFSTSRGLVVDALIMVGVIQLSASGRARIGTRSAALASAIAMSAVIIFVGVGVLGGHTFTRSGIGSFSNFFSRHPVTSMLALPYQDISAPVVALDVRLANSTTWGRAHGCSTFWLECRLARDVGLSTDQEPLQSPFTGSPLPWNAYTFLDTFLVDGGKALAIVLVAIMGTLIGMVWSLSRKGIGYATILYAFSVPVLVFSYRQNLLDTFASAALGTIVLLWAAERLSRPQGIRREPAARRLVEA